MGDRVGAKRATTVDTQKTNSLNPNNSKASEKTARSGVASPGNVKSRPTPIKESARAPQPQSGETRDYFAAFLPDADVVNNILGLSIAVGAAPSTPDHDATALESGARNPGPKASVNEIDFSFMFPSEKDASKILNSATEPVLEAFPRPKTMANVVAGLAANIRQIDKLPLVPNAAAKPVLQALPPPKKVSAKATVDVAQRCLNKHVPKGLKKIQLKHVMFKNGQIVALEIYRKDSKTKTKIINMNAAAWKGTRLSIYLGKQEKSFSQFQSEFQALFEKEIEKARISGF